MLWAVAVIVAVALAFCRGFAWGKRLGRDGGLVDASIHLRFASLAQLALGRGDVSDLLSRLADEVKVLKDMLEPKQGPNRRRARRFVGAEIDSP